MVKREGKYQPRGYVDFFQLNLLPPYLLRLQGDTKKMHLPTKRLKTIV